MFFRQLTIQTIIVAGVFLHLSIAKADEDSISVGCLAHNHCSIIDDASELTVSAFTPEKSSRLKSNWTGQKRYIESIATPFIIVSQTVIKGLDGLTGKVHVDFTIPKAISSQSPNCSEPIITVNDNSGASGEVDATDNDTVVVVIVCKPEVKTWGDADFSLYIKGDDGE